MAWQPSIPELSPRSLFAEPTPPQSSLKDPFVARFHEIPSAITVLRRGANIPPLRGQYEDWRSFIEDAVRLDAAPSRELIAANEMLAAWEAHLGVGKVSSFPITVGFSLTDVCNARCVFCAYVPERVVEERMSMDRLERADWLRFCKNYTPNGGGLGEPFAHPRILDALRIFKQKAPFLNFGSITNASLLSERIVAEIVGYVTYLYVSMNCARPETYERTMSPLKWDKLIGNLTALKAAKERLGTPLPRLRCGYVVHAHNLDELPEAPALLASLGFTDINVNFMTPPPHSENRSLYTAEDTVYRVPEKADAAFRGLEAECARHGIALVKPLPSLALLRAGTQVPLPDDAALSRTTNTTTGFHRIASGKADSAMAETEQLNTILSTAKLQPIETFMRRQSNSYNFAAYHHLQQVVPRSSSSEVPAAKAPKGQSTERTDAAVGAIGRLRSMARDALFSAGAWLGLVRPDAPVVAVTEGPHAPEAPKSMPQRTRPSRLIVIDHLIPSDLAEAVDTYERGVSYEWVRYAARGQKAFCWAPWRMMKVDIFDRTLICCNFFGKLPEFDWPTAQGFHAETSMWNHPFMQHLRNTMGTDDELPYCTFCKTSDKRHIGNADLKVKATQESLRVYQHILDRTRKIPYAGNIDGVEGALSDVSVPIGRVRQRDFKPFVRDTLFYRQLVRQRGFADRGRVLQLGVATASMTPFLAEAGNELVFGDWSEAAFPRVAATCSRLGLGNIGMVSVDPTQLPFPAETFDGVWIDGKWLRRGGRKRVLAELRRLLRPHGRVCFSQCSCVGDVVLEALAEDEEEAMRAVEVIRRGPTFDGEGNFISVAQLLNLLAEVGMTTDKTLPPQAIRMGGSKAKAAAMGNDHRLIGVRLADPSYRALLRDDRSQLDGLERSVSFTAVILPD